MASNDKITPADLAKTVQELWTADPNGVLMTLAAVIKRDRAKDDDKHTAQRSWASGASKLRGQLEQMRKALHGQAEVTVDPYFAAVAGE